MADTPLPATEAPLESLPADHPAQAYGALSARELLRFVQEASGRLDHPETQVVYTAFYHRYYRYLMTVVTNKLGFVRDENAIREIVHDALAAFFRRCGKFDLSRAKDDVGVDRLVRVYLARLAKWKAENARSFERSFSRDGDDGEFLERMTIPEQTDSVPGRDVRAVTEWIESLRPVDQDVLRAYFLDDVAGRKSDRLPSGVAEEIARRHGVTTSAIRHIKRKLLDDARERFAHLVR